MAMESFGDGLQAIATPVLLARAEAIEAYLWPEVRSTRPHHPCKEQGCVTPSGKTACHTCGEAWPCSTNLKA